MIVTRTRVGDHICKMSELFYYFSNCWSGYQCTFSRDPLQRSAVSRPTAAVDMFSNDKTVINTRHIVYCNDQTSRKKAAEPVKIWSDDSNCMHRLQICVFAGRYPDKTPPGQNTPCSFWHRWMKHPSCFLQGGHNTPCNFWQGGQNPPCKFCKVNKIPPIMWTKPPSDKIPLMLDWAPHQ